MFANYPWLMWGLIIGWTGLSIWLGNHTKIGRTLGYINLCIIGGFIFVNVGLVPQFGDQYAAISTYFVPVGIVCMLFMADLRKLWQCGKKMLLAMVISLVVIFAVCVVGGVIFSHSNQSWKLWACMTANFTGNMQTFSGVAASIGLDGSETVLFSATGMIAWMIYSLTAFTCGRWVIIKKFRSYKDGLDSGMEFTNTDNAKDSVLNGKTKMITVDEIAIVVGAAVAIAAVGSVIGNLLGIYPILIYAAIAVVIANFTPISKFKVSEDIGMLTFGMYIFSLGANATIANLAQSSWKVTAGIFFVYIVTFLLIALITKLTKLPWEYSLIAHNACVGGPASVPALCQNYEWTDLLMPAILLALIGQVFGSYLGIAAGLMIRMILGQ